MTRSRTLHYTPDTPEGEKLNPSGSTRSVRGNENSVEGRVNGYRPIAWAITTLFAVALAACGQQGPGPIALSVPGMERAEVRRDLVYKEAAGAKLSYDLYLPPGPRAGSRTPFVVLVHGGPLPAGISPKDWPVNSSYGRALAASGLAAVAFNYRFVAEDRIAVGALDMADLIAHVRAKAPEFGLDRDRAALWVFSGGGPQLGYVLRENAPYIRCLISFYARLDAPKGLEKYSPLELVRAGAKLPPTFIARMGKDFADLNASVDALVAEAKRRKLPVEVADYPDGRHGFDFSQPTPESRRIISRAIGFLKEHLINSSAQARPR